MSGHERERLSAYLDAELAPVERAEVEAHLAACAECTALLEQLAAVDSHAAGLGAVVGLGAEAPEGYFEGFAARVRVRIETSAGVRRRRVPAWTWAVAAALLLAVVTPLTLRQWQRAADEGQARAGGGVPGDTTPTASPEAPRGAVVAPPLVAQAGGGPTPSGGESRLREEASPAGAEAPRSAGLDRRLSERQGGLGEQEPAAPGGSHLGLALPRPAAPAPAAEPPAADSAVADSAVADSAGEADAVVGTLEEKLELSREVERAPADGAGRAKTARRAGVSAAPSAQPLGESERASAAGFTGRTTREDASAEDQSTVFRRLESLRPESLAAWRSAREAWRAFAVRYAGSPRADEARVRTLEAARQALSFGGTEEDAAAFRSDAAEYLARTDAPQKARVRRLLAGVEAAP